MRRVLGTWAKDAAAFAVELARLDPSWGSETFELAGGQVVLCGPGMYVNRAIAIGMGGPVSDLDLARLEARSAAVGVPAAVEVTSASDVSLIELARSRGYLAGSQTNVLRRSLDDVSYSSTNDDVIEVESANNDRLTVWQATSALGWGHVDEAARRASDMFAVVAAAVDGDGLVLATDARDGRPIGCAGLTISDGIATLGGMSTIPAERCRGVQSALIRYRLWAARSAGCAIATTAVSPGGGSERNLIRHGFESWFTITTLVRPD